jgi:halogenation protein CepH
LGQTKSQCARHQRTIEQFDPIVEAGNMKGMHRESFDVVVIGGGPGGAAVATLVALQGHRVLLLERSIFPRHQIGESLLPTTIHGICSMLGVRDEIIEAGFTHKLGGSFLWGKNPNPWNFTFGQSPALKAMGFTHAYQVERARFDTILLRNAVRQGVDVRESHTVLKTITHDDRVCGVVFRDSHGCEQEARARFVVDASGHQGRFHTLAGERMFSPFFRNVAVYAYFTNGKRLPAPYQGNILSSAFQHGWFWYIPLTETLTSVGAVIDRARYDKVKSAPEALLNSMIRKSPVVSDLLSGATRVTDGIYGKVRVRKDYSYENTRFWRPGLALIGDAACFIDPLFSSGVHLATYAALQVARAINTVLGGLIDEARCFGEFERRYRKEYQHFCDLVTAFYHQHVDENSYFWVARKILKTDQRHETSHESFLRLVAGASHAERDFAASAAIASPQEIFGDFLRATEDEKRHIASLAFHGRQRELEEPIFEGGLVPSRDGFHWCESDTVGERPPDKGQAAPLGVHAPAAGPQA